MDFTPKKSLGQHFLIDKNIQRKIVYSANFGPKDFVLEIGAGRGELTQLVAETKAEVYAIEIDRLLYKELKRRFKAYKNVKIINRDILSFNIGKYFKDITSSKIKVLGNIPYHITTPIVSHLIKYHQYIQEAFLTVQKEFAKRIVSQEGSKTYGAISCFIQYYTQPEILFSIKKTSFYPVPKVDSCFLRLYFKKRYPLKVEEEEELFKIIRLAFAQRRKMLKNALDDIIEQAKLDKFFRDFNMPFNVRAEDLSLGDFINLLKLKLNIIS